jgi:hypothetical protein
VNGFNGISVFPSVDAIEEFKLLGADYPAEFGRSLGSVLNVVFKSGTNQWHGSAYEFLRNSALDANDFFNNRRDQKLLSFKRSQFGGVLNGPIIKDKTFFMVSMEALRERRSDSTTASVPTALERTGDFSQTRTAARFVATTKLNCIAMKPSFRAVSIECSHRMRATPRRRAAGSTI